MCAQRLPNPGGEPAVGHPAATRGFPAMRSRGGLRTHPCSAMPTRISPPPNALVGLSFSPSTVTPTTTTVTSSQLAMIA